MNYLLLQDRVEEASQVFDKRCEGYVKAGDTSLRVQMAYTKAYISVFFEYPDFPTATEICGEYEGVNDMGWRKLFREMKTQISDSKNGGGEKKSLGGNDGSKEASKKIRQVDVAKLGSIKAEVDRSHENIKIVHSNIKLVEVCFYVFDTEILFSKDPFLKSSLENFVLTQPIHKSTVVV